MQQPTDWHPADIIAALKKGGTTLAALSREAGLSSSTLSNTLIRPWPKGEWLIAERIGIHPAEIWPTRYYDKKGNMLDRKSKIRQTTVSKATVSHTAVSHTTVGQKTLHPATPRQKTHTA